MLLAWEHLSLLWFSNSLVWLPTYVLILSTPVYGNLDTFASRTHYACLFSGEYVDKHFSLLDPLDGMPFTEIDGQLRKSLEIIHPLPKFKFAKPDREQSSFDILLNSSYVALFDSGRLGFVDRSSNGNQPINHGGETFITSIFDISCNGTISIRLPDLLQYNFIYHAPSRGVLGRPSGAKRALERRTSSALHNFVRRTQQAIDEVVPDSWTPFSFLVGPLKVSDRDQIGFQPRCPSKPFGLESFVKPGARPASFNGCGAENGMKIPDYRFTECCDNHDLCYDDCSMTWNQCNDNFRKCMHSQCNNNEPTWSEWGCNNLADVYADFVGTRLGAWSFYNSNVDRCTCGCPGGTTNCTDMCLPDCKERCKFVDCSTETSSAKLPKSTSRSKNSTSTPKTIVIPGPTSSAQQTTSSGSSATLLSTTPASLATSKTTSKTSSTTTPSPTVAPPPAGCPEEDNSDSWWPFEFWSTTTCAERNATFRTPREAPADTGNSKSSWWPSMSWFTTTNSPPKNETVDLTSVLRTETTIWWWPFL